MSYQCLADSDGFWTAVFIDTSLNGSLLSVGFLSRAIYENNDKISKEKQFTNNGRNVNCPQRDY